MRSDAFRGQVVIVTGASARTGKSPALQLACQGAKVAIAGRLEQVWKVNFSKPTCSVPTGFFHDRKNHCKQVD
jgi:NAD(P)-dependent dehydrogenase (short-subunit alcohol dehydrogenase family)